MDLGHYVRYAGTDYLPSRRTLSRVQPAETIFTRTSVLGRLVAFAIAGGVLAAAMVIPVVAATGVLVRNQADKFTTMSLKTSGLPQRSEILDRNGNPLVINVPGTAVELHPADLPMTWAARLHELRRLSKIVHVPVNEMRPI